MKHLKTSLKHIRRTPYQALVAVCIMSLTFLAISVFAFIVFGSSVVIQYFESKPQVTAFFKDEAKQEEIDSLKQALSQTGKVSKIRFVSKKEALKIYKQQNKEDPLLLDLVTEDILPASLEISTTNIEDMGAVSDMLKNSPSVSEVIYQKDVVATLTKWTNAIRIIGITLITILALVSIFIMMTVIGFKVSQKREEIEIMKLLSATNWYIRWPFILEGVFYGVIGTIIGWGSAMLGLIYAPETVKLFLSSLNISFESISIVFFLQLLAGELFIAIIIGMIASSVAVLRYLK